MMMGRKNEIPDNLKKYAVFRDIDTEKATSEQIVGCLTKIIDSEISKTEPDIDLIVQCTNLIEEFIPKKDALSDIDIEERLQKVVTSVPTAESSSEFDSRKSYALKVKSKSRYKFLKIICVVATITILLGTTLTIAAKTNGYGSAYEYVSAIVSDLLKLNHSERIDSGSITITRDGESKTYQSIEDLLIAENLNIMYPSSISDEIQVEKVSVISYNDKQKIIIAFSKTELSVEINKCYSIDITKISDSTLFVFNDIEFYIISTDTGNYQAICHYNGYEYTIISTDYSLLISSIQNMKEIEK